MKNKKLKIHEKGDLPACGIKIPLHPWIEKLRI